jgi:hypothetical protein
VKSAGRFAMAVLVCIAPAAAAQVGNGAATQVGNGAAAQAGRSAGPSSQREAAADAPKAPVYTPAQIYGAGPTTSGSGQDIDARLRRADAGLLTRPSSETGSPLGAGVNAAPNQRLPMPAADPPQILPAPPQTGSASARCNARTASAPPTGAQFPGVSTSQLPRAGVGADAFTRPGVSTEQLRALVPGSVSTSCPAPRDVILYPGP